MTTLGSFRFCPYCQTPLEPFLDEDRPRSRCPACGWIHYRNPTVGVAVALVEEDSLLLGKRREGRWCIPCGHVEWGEGIEEAALREFFEETGLDVELGGLLAVHSNFHNPSAYTVGIWFHGKRIRGEPRPGGDLREVRFFPLARIPELSFPTDARVIEELRASRGPSTR